VIGGGSRRKNIDPSSNKVIFTSDDFLNTNKKESEMIIKTYFFDNIIKQRVVKSLSIEKFNHYLVEFDSCIVSDNEVYNNYLTVYKNIEKFNLKDLPTSFCG